MMKEARPGGAGLLAAYYLYATPAFMVVDAVFGMSVRLAGIEAFGLRAGYYGLLVALGFLVFRLPRLAPWMAMSESLVNLFLLLLSVLLPIWTFPEAVLGGQEPTPLLGPAALVNVLLSGSVFIWSFHAHAAGAFVIAQHERR